MSGIMGRLFQRVPANGHDRYEAAMSASEDLIRKMRAAGSSIEAVRAVITDIWQRGHNVPFVTSIFETVQELKSGTDQNPHDRA